MPGGQPVRRRRRARRKSGRSGSGIPGGSASMTRHAAAPARCIIADVGEDAVEEINYEPAGRRRAQLRLEKSGRRQHPRNVAAAGLRAAHRSDLRVRPRHRTVDHRRIRLPRRPHPVDGRPIRLRRFRARTHLVARARHRSGRPARPPPRDLREHTAEISAGASVANDQLVRRRRGRRALRRELRRRHHHRAETRRGGRPDHPDRHAVRWMRRSVSRSRCPGGRSTPPRRRRASRRCTSGASRSPAGILSSWASPTMATPAGTSRPCTDRSSARPAITSTCQASRPATG